MCLLIFLWLCKQRPVTAVSASKHPFEKRVSFFSLHGFACDWKGSTKWRKNNTQSVAAGASSSFFSLLPPAKEALLFNKAGTTHTQAEENCCWPSSITFSLSTHTHTYTHTHLHTLSLSGHVTSTNISQLHNRKITYELQCTPHSFYNICAFVLCSEY